MWIKINIKAFYYKVDSLNWHESVGISIKIGKITLKYLEQ